MSKKKSPGFNSPFAAAQGKLAGLVKPPEPVSPTGGKAAAKSPAPKAPPPVDDARLFEDEMAGVAPIVADPRGRVGAPEPSARPTFSRRAAEEAEAYAMLADLVDGNGPFTVEESEEHLEFLAPGLDKRLLRKLRRGEYALQGHVDLHGMNRDEARAAVEDFLAQSQLAGKRCVLIVHGRGLHSKDEIPVLKERVRAWLERGRIAQRVLAFVSARPADGGTGALYVLLRR